MGEKRSTEDTLFNSSDDDGDVAVHSKRVRVDLKELTESFRRERYSS